MLGDLGTDVRRVGGFAFGLGVDAWKSGLVGAGGAAFVAVGVDAAGGLAEPRPCASLEVFSRRLGLQPGPSFFSLRDSYT